MSVAIGTFSSNRRPNAVTQLQLATIYDALHGSEFAEALYQTDAKEVWIRAIAALQDFTIDSRSEGIFLARHPHLLRDGLRSLDAARWQLWVFAPHSASLPIEHALFASRMHAIPLDNTDPLADEWFCVAITRDFAIAIVASHKHRTCAFTLHPQPLHDVLAVLKARIADPALAALLAEQLEALPLREPSYRAISKFGALLLAQSTNRELPVPEIREAELIEALAHEVKTPLTTIGTLARSLLKRQDISTAVRERIEKIGRECAEQIDRFHLIFEAVQLATRPVPLEATNLEAILSHSLDRWQQQAARRQIAVDALYPSNLPAIASNRVILDRLLNGLVDRLTRSLPGGSQIQMLVTLAGEHVKLQILSRLSDRSLDPAALRAVGQWLMLQPETGVLSLSLPIAKMMFQALGGKLTVRLHPCGSTFDGEILTVFLPVLDKGFAIEADPADALG